MQTDDELRGREAGIPRTFIGAETAPSPGPGYLGCRRERARPWSRRRSFPRRASSTCQIARTSRSTGNPERRKPYQRGHEEPGCAQGSFFLLTRRWEDDLGRFPRRRRRVDQIPNISVSSSADFRKDTCSVLLREDGAILSRYPGNGNGTDRLPTDRGLLAEIARCTAAGSLQWDLGRRRGRTDRRPIAGCRCTLLYVTANYRMSDIRQTWLVGLLSHLATRGARHARAFPDQPARLRPGPAGAAGGAAAPAGGRRFARAPKRSCGRRRRWRRSAG